MDINVVLDELLTSSSCVKLVIELLKYILYQKQQIPFTCDSLAQLQMKPTDRNLSSIKTVLKSLKNTSEQLNSQFVLEGCKIKEIAILIGATIITPKLHIRVEFPPDILSNQEHLKCKHTSRKPLLNLMRSMLECSEFQDALNTPLYPTNTFVLVYKSDSNSMSEFFLPKPQYVPSKHKLFTLKLKHKDQVEVNCNCADIVKIYNDNSEMYVNKEEIRYLNNSNIPYQWYQSKEVIKGFKYLR
ncbi:hypothetical protein ANTRET_LOCUS1120 [Anthophora retusa]